MIFYSAESPISFIPRSILLNPSMSKSEIWWMPTGLLTSERMCSDQFHTHCMDVWVDNMQFTVSTYVCMCSNKVNISFRGACTVNADFIKHGLFVYIQSAGFHTNLTCIHFLKKCFHSLILKRCNCHLTCRRVLGYLDEL